MSVLDRMSEKQKLECLEMLNDYLGVFATDFRPHMNEILAATSLLESAFLGQAVLSNDEKAKLFKTVIEFSKQYLEFVDGSLGERKVFMKSVLGDKDA